MNELRILRDFLVSVGVVALITFTTHLLRFGVDWLQRTLPVSDPPKAVEPYLPIEVTRWLVTVSDAVLVCMVVILAIGSLIRVAVLEYRRIARMLRPMRDEVAGVVVTVEKRQP